MKLSWAVLPLVLAACAPPPPLTIDVPSSWQSSAEDGVWPTMGWWQGFESAELSSLVNTAASNNRNLKAAVARILQAEAQAKISGAPQWPSLSAGGSLSRNNSDTRGASTTAQATLQASYQVDLFGQVRANANFVFISDFMPMRRLSIAIGMLQRSTISKAGVMPAHMTVPRRLFSR